jgi:predicted phage-related endonuclease
MDQTREKNGMKPRVDVSDDQILKGKAPSPPPGLVDTSSLAEQLEVTHIAKPAINTDVNLASVVATSSAESSPIKTVKSSTSVPSSDASSSVDRTDSDSDMEATRRLSSGDDATTSYKTAMYQYTVRFASPPLSLPG